MWYEIGRFVLFVVSYFALAAAGLWLLAREITQPYMTWYKALISAELGILLNMGTFIVYFILLAGYWDARLLLLLFGALEISVLVAVVLFWFLESGPSRWAMQGLAFARKFAETHPAVGKGLNIYNVLVAFGFPIAAGIVYFSFSGYQLTVHVLQLINIFVIATYVPLIFSSFILLTEPAADENMRNHVLVNILQKMFPASVYFAFAFWTFRVAPGASSEEIGRGLPLQLSPLVIVALISLFLLGAIAPYVIGVRRGKLFRVRLHEEEKEYVEEVINVLKVPLVGANTSKVSAKLEEQSRKLFGNLVQKTKELVGIQTRPDFPEEGRHESTSRLPSLTSIMNSSTLSNTQFNTLFTEAIKDPDTLESSLLPIDFIEGLKPVVVADQDPNDLEPLVKHLRWLRELTQEVWQAREDLEILQRENAEQAEEQDPDRRIEWWELKETWRQQWLDTFKDQRKRSDVSIQTEQDTKAPILVAASTIASAGMGFFTDKVASWAWVIFQSSQGR